VGNSHPTILPAVSVTIGFFMVSLLPLQQHVRLRRAPPPPAPDGGGLMTDAWFIGLAVALAVSTWGAIVLFARLLKQP
jgi:hypothetical protein